MRVTGIIAVYFAALFAAAAPTNSVLDYVDGSASWVAYGNSSAVLQHKVWRVAERVLRQAGEYDKILNELSRDWGVSPEEVAGEIVVWGDEVGARNVVVKLKYNNAHALFDKITRAHKKNARNRSWRFAVENFVNGCRVFYCGYKDDKRVTIWFSMLCNSNDTLQFFIGEQPDTPLIPRGSNPLIQKIDRTKIASAAASGNFFKRLAARKAQRYFPMGIPPVGDVTVNVHLDNNKIRVEAEADISAF